MSFYLTANVVYFDFLAEQRAEGHGHAEDLAASLEHAAVYSQSHADYQKKVSAGTSRLSIPDVR
jgi:hypothetical protein